jgi:uncharacterized membrane protein YagU involved in acid resistance
MMKKILLGSVAGAISTIPMTAVMESMYRQLPLAEKDPLPPRVLTMKILQKIFPKMDLTEDQRIWVTLLSHIAFGSFLGTIYGLNSSFSRDKDSQDKRKKELLFSKGLALGIIAWLINYQIIIPTAQLLPAATKQSFRKNILMVTSHIVWGLSVVGLFNIFSRKIKM